MPGSHYSVCEKCGGTIYCLTYGEAQKAKLCAACEGMRHGVVDYAGTKTAKLTPDPSLVEQLARRLELFASDQIALARGKRSATREHRAAVYRSSATELRDAMTAQNKALYQVEINTILERFGVSETIKDEISLAIVKEFMG